MTRHSLLGPRRAVVPWAVGLTCLLLSACQHPFSPASSQRRALRLGVDVLGQNIEVGDEEGNGPYPGIEAYFARVIGLEGTTETSIEIGGNIYDLDPGGDFEGTGYRPALNLRRTWKLDRRLRYTASIGASWTTFQFKDIPSGNDVKGPGVSASGGIEYLIGPQTGVGAATRGQLHYWDATRETEFGTSIDLVLYMLYRF